MALASLGALAGMGCLVALPYLLHVGSGPQSTQTRVVVDDVNERRGGKRRWCPREIVLVGDTFPWRQRLCSVGPALSNTIAPGDELILRGRNRDSVSW